MTSIKAARWTLVSLLWLSACSDEKLVVIQPGAFSQEWPTALREELVENDGCVIDRINGNDPYKQALSFKSGEPLVMSGWTFSKKEGTPPAVYVQLVSPTVTYTALAQKRTARPDVNGSYQLDSELTPGFELTATQKAEPGEYRIEMLQVGKSSVSHCETPVSITIK